MLVVFWLCLDQMKVLVFAQCWKHFNLLDYFFVFFFFRNASFLDFEQMWEWVGAGFHLLC